MEKNYLERKPMRKLLDFIDRTNNRFWGRIVENTTVSADALGLLRIIAGFCMLFFSFKTYAWIGDVPAAFYNPPKFSLGSFVNTFPPKLFFQVCDFLLLLFVLLITIGVKAKAFTSLFVIFSIVLSTFDYSFGKINHSIILYATLACLAFSGWGNKFALIPDKYNEKESQRAISLLAVIIVFGMFTAGVPKLFRWINLDMNSNGFLSWYYRGKYFYGRTHLLAPYVELLPTFMVKGFDFVAVLFELSGCFMLLRSPKTWRLWLMMAIVFHIMVALFLNINFLTMLIPYIVFLRFDRIINVDWFKAKINWIAFLLLLLVFVRTWMLLTARSRYNLFSEDNLGIGIIIWLVVLILFVIDVRYVQKRQTKA